MATVFLARDLKHGRLVALKLLRPELSAGLGPERFLREIQVTARLQHPHILPLLDSGEVRDSADPTGRSYVFYVMPYVEGESLRSRLLREPQLPLEEAVRITEDVASALEYAHAQGVVHRDIKPENILLSRGQAVVADFGIARAVSSSDAQRLTETGLALGTPHYMSPEQAAAEPVDGRTDIYALGCVLYEMLVGEPPYTGPTAQAILARRLMAPAPKIRPVRESVSESLEHAVIRALARAPADRFSTAGEFAAALTQPSTAPRPAGARWRIGAALLALLAVGAALALLKLHRSAASVVPSASLIAVLPFTPSGPDTALARLGRDLVFTISAELDGLADIRVVDAHTVLAQTAGEGIYSPAADAALARRFGAGSLVHGSLVREGAQVRLDFVLLPTDSNAKPVARASITGALDSVATLTDAAVHALLKQIWTGGSAPTPSLEGALKTGSVQALRAFLQGEQEIVGGRWDSAATSYGRAREADPAFWLAAAREVFALNWAIREAPANLLADLRRHRLELPDAERLSTDAILMWSADSIGLGLARSRELSRRYPSSWFGWLIYADQLLHNGPILGHSTEEARAGFERALDLNPNLIPVHEHLMLLALQARDTAAARRGLGELARLDAGPTLTADGYGNRMLQFRFLDGIERGDSALTRALVDSMARDPAPEAVHTGSFYDAFLYGFLDWQIRVSQRGLRVGSPPAREINTTLLALSWAGRGAWDSALVAMDRLVATGLEPGAPLRAYGLAVVGAWVGAVDPREAQPRRAPAVAAADTNGADRAEVAWLDGLLAVSRRDRHGVAEARAELGRTGDPGAKALDRSLEALDAGLAGKTDAAATALAALEWQEAAVSAPDFLAHPYTIAVDRLAAARWLAASGDTEQAARLLTSVDGAYFLHPSTLYSLMLTGLVDLERGRIEEQRGHEPAARDYYREFLRRYDRPMPNHRQLVEEAKAGMGRLTPAGL